jgi:hypothetical protein
MPLILGNKPEGELQPQRPLFERIQDLIFRMDVGAGFQFFRLGLFAVLVLVVILFYTGTQFYGLRDPQAMDMGQLARNLARGRGYVTQNIRPLDVWYLNSIGRPTLEPGRNAIPELWTPPAYPLVLSVALKMVDPKVDLSETLQRLGLTPLELPAAGDWRRLEVLCDAARTQTLRMDRVLVVVAWAFYLVGMILLYVVARDLFDHRVAVTSVFLYLFCDPLLDSAVAGLSFGFLTLLFMVTTLALFQAEKWQESGKPAVWVNSALAASALAVALGTLTQYAFVAVLVPLLVYVGVSFRKSQWQRRVGLCAAVFALTVAPWVARNWKVSQTWFGLGRTELYEGVRVNALTEIKPGQLQRVFGVQQVTKFRPIVRKALVNVRKLYEVNVKDIGSSYLIAFFFASLLHRFRRDEVFRLRRFLFWSLIMCVLWLAVTGPPKRNVLTMFLPLIIIYGTAFFYVMFERLQFRTRLLRQGMVGLFVFINALPFVFTILPPQTTSPYPPYDGGVVAAMGKTFREEDMLVSDIPWAVAWYADRSAIWTPFEKQDYLAINDNVRAISGIYLTQATLLQQDALEMIMGYQRFWLEMFPRPSPELPLQYFRPLTPDGQQVLISNRPH